MGRILIAIVLSSVFWVLAFGFMVNFAFLCFGPSSFHFNETDQDDFERTHGIRQQLSAVLAAKKQLDVDGVTFSPVPFSEEEYRRVESGDDTWTFFWGKLIQTSVSSRYEDALRSYSIAFQLIFYLGILMVGILVWWLYAFRFRKWIRYSVCVLLFGAMVLGVSVLSRCALPESRRVDRNFESQLVAADGLLRQKLDAPRPSLLDSIAIDGHNYSLFVAPEDIFGCNYIRLNIDLFTYYFYGPDLSIEKLRKLNQTMDYVQITPQLFRGCYSKFSTLFFYAGFFRIADIILLIGGYIILLLCALRWRPETEKTISDSALSGSQPNGLKPEEGCSILFLGFILLLVGYFLLISFF